MVTGGVPGVVADVGAGRGDGGVTDRGAGRFRVGAGETGAVVMGGPPPILEFEDLWAGYGDVPALRGVSLAVDEGRVLALLGPNGGGKSTALRVAAGLLAPSAGRVRLAGRALGSVAAAELARLGVCLIPEGRGVFPNLTVRENLLMMTGAGAPAARVAEIACRRFPSLTSRQDQLAGTLSGGEQQMLALARALVTDPAVLLLDELSMGLAPRIVEEIYAVVGELAAAGVAVVAAEQFAQTALGVADRVAVMVNGSIVVEGSPEEVRPRLADAYLSRDRRELNEEGGAR